MDYERNDVNNIYDRISRLSEQVAVSSERERQLALEIVSLKEEVDEMKSFLAKGRGGILVLVAIGSIIGLVLGAWDRIAKLFYGGH